MARVSRTLQAPVAAAPRTPDGAGWISAPGAFYTESSLRRRLLGEPLTLRLWGWLLPVLTAVIGGVLRFVRLGEPDSLVFDETYYVKDAFSYLQSGYERDWAEESDDAFAAGDLSVLLETPSYVVHPPVGKWMIAFGMWLFGPESSFGWRFSAALIGTISILLLALIAQRMFHSVALGSLAGLLLAIDGHHLVHSRTSLLDIFLMFWLLVAFGLLLLDRDDGRRRLARRLAAATQTGADRMAAAMPPVRLLKYGPFLGMRWWRLAAGVALGLAVGTKWSALFFLAAFGLMTVLWDMNARRVAGIRRWVAAGVLKDGVLAFLALVPVAALTYGATWAGWFSSTNAYDRQWAQSNPSETWGWLPPAVRSLAEYHRSAYSFHQGLGSDHPYKANPWTWLVMGRPTSFFYEPLSSGEADCAAEKCSQAVSVVGNPLIWWAGALSLLVLLLYWIGRRDWRAGAILAGIGAGYLPWFLYPERTTFFFYAISFEPFLILSLVFSLGLVLGSKTAPAWRRQSGMVLVGLLVVVALALSAFFLPIWTAETIPYQHWQWRMWMPSWI